MCGGQSHIIDSRKFGESNIPELNSGNDPETFFVQELMKKKFDNIISYVTGVYEGKVSVDHFGTVLESGQLLNP